MFCYNCGKEIVDGVKFCPNCGKSQNVSESSIKDKMVDAVGSALSTAKTAGGKALEDEKIRAYTSIAQETAQNFADDVKQVAQDKDTSNFFKKNKFRNSKIIVGIIAILLIFTLFIGKENHKGFKEAEEKAVESTKMLTDVKKVNSSEIVLVGYNPKNKSYAVIISVKADAKEGLEGTLFYLAGIDKEGNITYFKADKGIYPSDKNREKELLANRKNIMQEQGFEIK